MSARGRRARPVPALIPLPIDEMSEACVAALIYGYLAGRDTPTPMLELADALGVPADRTAYLLDSLVRQGYLPGVAA